MTANPSGFKFVSQVTAWRRSVTRSVGTLPEHRALAPQNNGEGVHLRLWRCDCRIRARHAPIQAHTQAEQIREVNKVHVKTPHDEPEHQRPSEESCQQKRVDRSQL